MKITIEGENLKVSDGYHTIEELYDHRITLFIALCKSIKTQHPIWMSEFHADGSNYDGWFIMGIETESGKQISYHLPMNRYDQCSEVVHSVLDKAPEWDGHTSHDVLRRISNL